MITLSNTPTVQPHLWNVQTPSVLFLFSLRGEDKQSYLSSTSFLFVGLSIFLIARAAILTACDMTD